jgi:WD40 repeat protein
VTALVFSPAGFDVPVVLAGEGTILKVFCHKQLLRSIKVFRRQAIHGIQSVRVTSLDDYHHPPQLRCLVWGGRSLAVISLEIKHEGPHEFYLKDFLIVKETISPDWILHGTLSPARTWTDGLKEPFVQALVVSAHNDLIALELSRVFQSDEYMRINLRHCAIGPSSILYCAQCIWRDGKDVVVAAGTMFGEILVWKHRMQHESQTSPTTGSLPKGVLIQSLLGHEGSVFGIDVIEPGVNDSDTRHLLASCSDERTVRLWDVSDSFSAKTSEESSIQLNQDTGFGDKSSNVSSGALAFGIGHLSRIWSVKGIRFFNNRLRLFSFGEDATVHSWDFDLQSQGDAAAQPRLDHIMSTSSHSGKNLWSSSVLQYRPGSGDVTLASGGADGRIVTHNLHRATGDSCSQQWSFPFRKLHSAVIRDKTRSNQGSSDPTQAIFSGMKGTWHLHRTIVSALPSHPSGTFEGTATLDERPCSDSEYDQELLYSEKGTFTMSNGLALQGTRQYAYRYQKALQRITAWFVTLDDEARVDYLFHQVEFRARQVAADQGHDVHAQGHHLCIKDDYNAAYSFPFQNSTLNTWSLTYLVKGPSKDYTASATFTRIADMTNGTTETCIQASKSEEQTAAKEQSIKAYCWLDGAKLLATTSSGHILLGASSASARLSSHSIDSSADREISYIIWKMIHHVKGLESYSMITPISGVEALLTGKDGILWRYHNITEQLQAVQEFPVRIAHMSVFVAHGHHGASHGVLVTCLGQQVGSVVFLQDAATDEKVSNTTYELDFSHTPLATSVCYLPQLSLLLVGFRTGAVCAYDLGTMVSGVAVMPVRELLNQTPGKDEAESSLSLQSSDSADAPQGRHDLDSPSEQSVVPLEPCLTILKAHHRDAVTSIQLLPSDDAQSSFNVLTTGRDGYMVVHSLSLPRAPDLTIQTLKVHEWQTPLGPVVEGAHIDSSSHDILIWGFRGKDFVVWNTAQQQEVMSVECGGGHRSWAFEPSARRGHGHSFVWTKASTCYAVIQSEYHQIVQAGSHGREIKCLASRQWSNRGRLVASGSEDTTIRLAVYGGDQGELRTVCVLAKHVAGVQQVKWSSDGRRLFSCGGREEFFVWRVRVVPGIETGVVLEACAPPVTEISSDLRIMDFTITKEESCEGSREGLSFIISMIYSDSTLRVSQVNLSPTMKVADSLRRNGTTTLIREHSSC